MPFVSYFLTLFLLLSSATYGANTTDTIGVKQSVPSSITHKPVYYPQCSQTPLRVGEENYQKSYLALRGLTGIYLDIDGVLKGARKKGVTMREGLKEEVIKRLNKAGIRLLTKKEMELTRGQPKMSMFPSFPKHLKAANISVKVDEVPISYQSDCCQEGIWTSFTQGATTLRDPYTHYNLGTWGEGHNTHDCSDIGGWMSDVILKTIDSFTEDKLEAEEDYKKMLSSGKIKLEEIKKEKTDEGTPPAKTGNMVCNTSLMMYIEMFKTNATTIMPSKYYVLNKLADAMLACPQYNYLIETHADQRSSHEYNYHLSTKRAKSIQYYLLSRGVPDEQFEIQPFGDSRPITKGTTAEDYATNRRVVVTPYRMEQ